MQGRRDRDPDERTLHGYFSRPFMGVMGTAPDEPVEHSTIPPRVCGGNLDCRELVSGSTLYLPIAVEGALFSWGDGHAALERGRGLSRRDALAIASLEVDLRVTQIVNEVRGVHAVLRDPTAEG